MASAGLRRLALAATLAGALLLSIGAAHAQFFGFQRNDTSWTSTPRVSLPSANLLPKAGSCVGYFWRGARFEGRKLNDHGYEARVALTPLLELGWDRHKLRITGKSGLSSLDSRTNGWQLRYGLPLGETRFAAFTQYRTSHADYQTPNFGRTPPGAKTWTLGGVMSRPFGGRNQLHLVGAGSSVKCGPQSALSFELGAGLDHRLMRDLTLQGNAGMFLQTGDVKGTDFALGAGLHYENRIGLTVDLAGTFLPGGPPLAGDPMADAAAFVLDPALSNRRFIDDFRHASLASYTIRAGYTTRF